MKETDCKTKYWKELKKEKWKNKITLLMVIIVGYLFSLKQQCDKHSKSIHVVASFLTWFSANQKCWMTKSKMPLSLTGRK